jgi:esterase
MLLFHRDLGGEGRPPLVILHGLLGSSRNWQTAGADLAAKFHVCALDLRNHGRSPHGELMTYDVMMNDVLIWLDARGISKTALLGHSLGGKVAMRLACRHPERVARLVVVDIAPKDYPSGAYRDEFAAMNQLDLNGLNSRAEAEAGFGARVRDWAMRKFLATNLERGEDGRWRWLINLPVLTQALPELEKNSLRPEDRYDGPALFVRGEKSRYVLADDYAEIRRHFPPARIETIAAAGHNPHMETRQGFVRTILDENGPLENH